MKRHKTKQSGVSLVEVVLTLAIASLLLAAILAGRGSVKNQAQFMTDMETLKETILTAKSQANATLNPTPDSTGGGVARSGGKPNYLVLGQVIQFTKNSSQYATATVLCYIAQTPAELNSGQSATCQQTTHVQINNYQVATVPGSDMYTDDTIDVLFIRDPVSSNFTGYGYVVPNGTLPLLPYNQANGQLGRYDLLSQYTVQVATQPQRLHFRSPNGLLGYIDINPLTGTVTR